MMKLSIWVNTHTFGNCRDIIGISRTIHQHLFSNVTFLLISQREREAMKDKITHYSAMDKWYESDQQICGSASISCIVRKTGPILPPLKGLMAGRQAGWQTKLRWISIFRKLSSYMLTYLDFVVFNITAILLQCWDHILVSFCQQSLVQKCEKFSCHLFHVTPYHRAY